MTDSENQTTELLERVRNGDPLAREALCRAYQPRLRAYFGKHRLGEQDVEDAVQETITRMLGALDAGRIRFRTFDRWIFATARNVRIDLYRRSAREHVGAEPDTRAAEEDTERRCQHKEAERLLARTIRALPDHLREVFVLRHDRGMNYRDIAEELDISINAVGLRLHRARRILQEKLEGRI